MDTLEILTVSAFFLVTCVVGLLASRKTNSGDAFFIGSSRPIGTEVLSRGMAIFILTNGAFFGDINFGFSKGIQYGLLSNLGLVFMHCLFAYVFSLKIAQLDSVRSPGDLIDRFYGETARAATGICSVLLGFAYFTVQLHALGCLCHEFLQTNYTLSVIAFAVGMVTYTAAGGFGAILKTRNLYFGIVALTLFLLIFFAIQKINSFQTLVDGLPPGHMKLTLAESGGFGSMFILLLYCLPIPDPGSLQYLVAAQRRNKIKKTLLYTALLGASIWLIPTFFGALLRFLYPTATHTFAFSSFIRDHIPYGARGLVLAGIMAICVSTADVFLHSASISLIRDLVNPMARIKLSSKAEVYGTRASSILLGILSVSCLIGAQGFSSSLSTWFSVFAPIVGVPMAMAMLGIRGHRVSFYIGMFAGIATHFVWKSIFTESSNIDVFLPASGANLLLFFATELFLRPFKDVGSFSD